MMNRLVSVKDVFRRHLLWVGLLAVAIPLLVHLWLQYDSLMNLQATMPVARKVYMRRYLSTVLYNISTAYEKNAEKALSVPAKAFLYRYPPPERIAEDQFNLKTVLDLETIWNHF